MSQSFSDNLNRMTTGELCDFMRGWIHSLAEDRFSRVLNVVKLESEFREKIASKRKSNESTPDSVGSLAVTSKSPQKAANNVVNSEIDLSDWICVFCKQTSHARGLGDLFGPYFIGGQSNEPKPQPNPNKPRAPPKKMKYTEYNNSGSEIWFHDSCISWASGVYLIGNQIKNVEEIISKSSQNICFACHMNGANIGCLSKGCEKLYHFLCAKENNCLMDETTFSITCPNHRTSSPISSNHSNSVQNSHHQRLDQPHSSRSFT